MSFHPNHDDVNALKLTVTSISSVALDEKKLVKRLKARDEKAYPEFISNYEDKVYGFAFRLLRNQEDAEDIGQEVFLSAWQSIDRFRGECKITTWLYTITKNLCFNKLRKLEKLSEKPFPVDEDFETRTNEVLGVGTPEGDPKDALEKKEMNEQLWARIDQLKPRYRAAVILIYKEELTYKEASIVLGSPVGTLKSLVSRAMEMLRNDEEISQWGI